MKKYIVIDIGGTAIKYGIIDESSTILEKKSTPTEAFLGGEHVRDKVLFIVSEYEGIGKSNDPEYAGVAISTAGMVNTKEGSIFHAGHTMPGYTGIALKAPIEEKFGIPCEVENDVNCAGIAEYMAGAGKGSSSMLCLTVGTGIGGCAIIDGKVLHGFTGSGCEVGYMNMHGTTFEKLGAASVMSSKVAAVKQAGSNRNVKSVNWNGIHIFDEANKGDADCIRAIDEMCGILGEGIANICYILNPEVVVMGGGIMARTEYLYPRIRSAMDANMESVIARNTTLKFAEFKNSAGMMGAFYNFRRLH